MLAGLWTKAAILLAILAVIACAVAVISRNWKPAPKPHVERLGPFEVVAAPTGASLTIAKRLKRTGAIVLDGIEAPPVDAPFGIFSSGNLAVHVGIAPGGESVMDEATGKPVPGPTVFVEVLTDKRFGKPDLCGEVFSASGENLNLVQLTAGLAKAAADAPANYKAAEAEAKKAKRGIWSKPQAEDGENAESAEGAWRK